MNMNRTVKRIQSINFLQRSVKVMIESLGREILFPLEKVSGGILEP